MDEGILRAPRGDGGLGRLSSCRGCGRRSLRGGIACSRPAGNRRGRIAPDSIASQGGRCKKSDRRNKEKGKRCRPERDFCKSASTQQKLRHPERRRAGDGSGRRIPPSRSRRSCVARTQSCKHTARLRCDGEACRPFLFLDRAESALVIADKIDEVLRLRSGPPAE